jgi:hypothetical protein
MGETLDTGVPDADTLVLSDVARIALRRSFEGDGADSGKVRFVLAAARRAKRKD